VFLHQYLLVEIWQVLVINNRPVGRGVTGLLRFLFDQAGFLGHKGGNKVLPFLDSVRRRDPIRIEPDFFFLCVLALLAVPRDFPPQSLLLGADSSQERAERRRKSVAIPQNP
jgi:hypothetical protein